MFVRSDLIGLYKWGSVVVFSGFTVLPSMILVYLRKRIVLGGLDKGFLYGVLSFVVFSLYVLYFRSNLSIRFGPRLDWFDFVAYCLYISIWVSSVEFGSKYVVQRLLTERFGDVYGFLGHFLFWICIHVPEYYVNLGLMGSVGSLAFIVLSGLLTGYIFLRTRNVLGLMVGHSLLNVLLVLF